MRRNYRPVVVLALTGLFGGFALWQTVSAQDVKKPLVAQRVRPVIKVAGPVAPAKPKADAGMEQFAEGVTLQPDRRKRMALQAARDFIDAQQYGSAIDVLQNLLTRSKEDVFIDVSHKENGKTVTEPRSLFHEADRLIGSLPPEGLEEYQLKFNGRAKGLLEEARKNNDRKLLAEVALKYHHTDAGAEAANLLGTLYLDRGDYVTADRSFDSLLNHRNADKLSAMTLLKAALAFRRTGDVVNYNKAWPILRRKIGADGLTVGDQTLSIDQVEALLNRARGSDLARADREVPMFGGTPSRCTQYVGGNPYLDDVKWSWETIAAPSDSDKNQIDTSTTREWVTNAVQTQKGMSQPVLPGFFPLAVTAQTEDGPKALLVYRSYYGVHAVDLHSGEVEWFTASDHSLEHLLGDPNNQATIRQWWQQYASSSSGQVLYENSLLGTLSTDGTRVYAVDDLALPPHPQYMNNFMWQQKPSWGTFLDDAMQCNRLQAYELDGGKEAWSIGGMNADQGDLQGSYFLGPPLPLGGKLYVLNEKKSELRLLCLDSVNNGAVLWSQVLANYKDSLDKDVSRRMHAAHLAYGEGILVCPTNAGAILAVDLLTHSLVWAKAYKEAPAQPANPNRMGMPMMAVQRNLSLGSEWKDCVPIIADGRVVFTAPDSPGVVCLDLRTGDKKWSTTADVHRDSICLAGVYDGKVLLVGKGSCRALDLKSGSKIWETTTGLPSGQGVAASNVYYLPLEHGLSSPKQPEVCRIDISTGKILNSAVARVRPGSEDQQQVPGNLIFFGDEVISQTATDVKIYPQVDAKIRLIAERLKKNPHDPIGLTEEGAMYLDKGDSQKAADDLFLALDNHPPTDILPKTQAKLFDALTVLLKDDFSKNEKYLDVYEKLCDVALPHGAGAEETLKVHEEHRQRLAKFLALKARGREKQGRLVDAFEAYSKFGMLAGQRELIASVDDSSIQVRPDLWAQERIAAMLQHASSAQRKPLEERIATRWRTVKSTGNSGKLREFVAVFGVRSSYGRQAMLQLGEMLLKDPKGFLEGELMLLQLRNEGDKSLAGQAIEALARGMIHRNLMDDAAYYYGLLGREFADTVIRDGRTGGDLYNELATDKRFWPYLAEPRQSWANRRLRAKVEMGNYPMNTAQMFVFEPEGEVLPYFRSARLEVFNNSTLRLVDRQTGKDRFRPKTGLNGISTNWIYSGANSGRLPYEVEGHLLVFSYGHMVYGFNALTGEQLWEKNLFGSGPQLQQQQIMTNKDGTMDVLFAGGFRMRLGRTGPVQPSYVCLETRRGLIAFDPLTGNHLWTRTGITPNIELFGDNNDVYILEYQQGGSAAAGVAFRSRDGIVAKNVPDFAKAYEHRVRLIGSRILVNDPQTDGKVALRLYDVRTGKDLWKRTFGAGAKVVQSEDPDLVGVVEPNRDNRVTVFDVRTHKDVFLTRLLTPNLDKVADNGFRLITDDDHYYLTVNKPPENNGFQGGTWSAFNAGFRTAPVNGRVWAYHRDTGKLHWWVDVDDQLLMLDRFNEMPILLFACRSNRMMAGKGIRRWVQRLDVVTVEKRTGKLLYEPHEADSNQLNNQTFYAVNIDPKGGTVDLLSYQLKIHHYVVPNKPSVKFSTPEHAQLTPAAPPRAVLK